MNEIELKRPERDPVQPLYVQLAQTLGLRIADGRYPVGGLLPTEAELGDAFGVSRYTVRQAIQHLRQQGLVSARKGVGTRVEARRADASYSHAIHSLSELLQYASETRLEIVSHEEIIARGALAEMLGCRPRKPWIRLNGVRHGRRGEPPHGHSEIYLDAAYKDLTTSTGPLRTALWSLIERRFGETVVEVDQEIQAAVLDADMARLLKAEPGSPALKFTRRYYVTGRRLVEYTVSLHPADRFSYHMTMKRDQPIF
jgi:GntR family transcriptional regulator